VGVAKLEGVLVAQVGACRVAGPGLPPRRAALAASNTWVKMKFKEVDSRCNREKSDALAHLLKEGGIRFEQRCVTRPRARRVYVLDVHPDDLAAAAKIVSDAERRERDGLVRRLALVRERFASKNMLIARDPNEAGYYISSAYNGETFDDTRFKLVRGGWDHQHCFLCDHKVWPGDEWWSAKPPGEIGLCLDCHHRLFAGDSTGR
jgi:hypothetical protein